MNPEPSAALPQPAERAVPQASPAGTHIPRTTYRLQFNSGFVFRDAIEAVEYLRDLGVSDVYASPLFTAGPQSTHGYDVCRHDTISPVLGGLKGLKALAEKLQAMGMSLLLDIVPNHMGNDLSNPWWRDVLRQGRQSPYASWFDINWDPPVPTLKGKVLVPVLGEPYGTVLESGQLKVVFRRDPGDGNGAFALAYFQREFPLSPESERAIADAIAQVQLEGGPEKPVDRIEAALVSLNGKPGVPESFDTLDRLMSRQHYRLAYWRAGPEQVNYRRFFDVMELVSVRVEVPEVFRATHRLIFDLLQKRLVAGLRIDHPDGLGDPAGYLQRLQQAGPVYVVVEKILSGPERLPVSWPVHGTTGYDFLNVVNGLFVDPAAERAFDRTYSGFAGSTEPFTEIVYRAKKQILEESLVSELGGVVQAGCAVAWADRRGRDFTQAQVRSALKELIASFPVYRTYIDPATVAPCPQDELALRRAIEAALPRLSAGERPVLEFFGGVLRLTWEDDDRPDAGTDARRFAMRFQQLTGPATAKGLEDTAFYRFFRLISLNEVGGAPDRFGVSVGQFHEHNLAMAASWPHTLLATATHDTKRGEDLRARIDVLSEMPGEWEQAVRSWAEVNRPLKTSVAHVEAPSRNDEFLFYQTLVGAWTREAEFERGRDQLANRLEAYMLKAVREAKVFTRWTDPCQAYEQALTQFVRRTLANPDFLLAFKPFWEKVRFFGALNSLAQVLLKLTAPGVPDIYQGTELWDFSLVDPDNRRPVDFSLRARLLAQIRSATHGDKNRREFLGKILSHSDDGLVKFYLTWAGLQFRVRHAELFLAGRYLPLEIQGAKRDHAVAFARHHRGCYAVTVAPRLTCRLSGGELRLPLGESVWGDTRIMMPPELAGKELTNALTRERVTCGEASTGGAWLQLGRLLDNFPVALLGSDERDT